MVATIPVDVSLNAMVQFEQRALRSRREKMCASCGDPGTVEQGPTAYCHVVYFMCADCDAYYKAKDAE